MIFRVLGLCAGLAMLGSLFLPWLATNFGPPLVPWDLIKSVIDLSRELGIDCCAEGIETQVQAIALKALGCSKGQGYLYGRAIPAKHFEGLLGVDSGSASDESSYASGSRRI